MIGEPWHVAATPFDFQARETNQEPNEQGDIQERVNQDSQRTEEFAPNLPGLAPQQNQTDRREEGCGQAKAKAGSTRAVSGHLRGDCGNDE